MKKFQDMCSEEFDNVNLLKRGGQKVVFDGNHKIYKDSVIIARRRYRSIKFHFWILLLECVC